jgi:hypothetical protein
MPLPALQLVDRSDPSPDRATLMREIDALEAKLRKLKEDYKVFRDANGQIGFEKTAT